MDAVTQSALGTLCGVSKVAIHKAIKAGRCPVIKVDGKIKIDLHDPTVQKFMKEVEANKQPTPKVAYTPKVPTVPNVISVPVDLPADDQFAVKMRKAVASADLEEVKAKIKSEEYFEKVGAVVDRETLRIKMGKFTDVLVTSLLYYPEEIADSLWVRAKAAGDSAPKVIREVLADRLETIIENAKAAAREIVSEEKDRRYIVIDEEVS